MEELVFLRKLILIDNDNNNNSIGSIGSIGNISSKSYGNIFIFVECIVSEEKKPQQLFYPSNFFFFSVKHFSTLFCHLSGFFCRIYRRSKKRSAIFYRIYQIQQQRLYFTLAFHSNLFLNFFSGTIIAVSFFFPSLSPLRLLLTAVCNCV